MLVELMLNASDGMLSMHDRNESVISLIERASVAIGRGNTISGDV
jgi:hypothetical protein